MDLDVLLEMILRFLPAAALKAVTVGVMLLPEICG